MVVHVVDVDGRLVVDGSYGWCENGWCSFLYLGDFNLENIVMGTCSSKGTINEGGSSHGVELVGGNIRRVANKGDWDQIMCEAKADGKTVVSNFSAVWCSPCRMIAQLYTELSEKHPSIIFLLVDVDEMTEFSTAMDIKATPTFFFYRDGEVFDKLVGANKPELQTKITALVVDHEL